METKNWFNKSEKETVEELQTNETEGFSSKDLEEKRAQYGFNELQEAKKKSLFVKFLEQFKDFMIIVLIVAAVISGVVGYIEGEGITDSIIIMVVVIVNAIIGVAQENKAEKSLEALKKLSSYSAKVIRDGKITVVPSRDLVPGDLVVFNNDANTKIGHVGIYIGDGNFIHASNPSDGVKITTLKSGYYNQRYVGARRVY